MAWHGHGEWGYTYTPCTHIRIHEVEMVDSRPVAVVSLCVCVFIHPPCLQRHLATPPCQPSLARHRQARPHRGMVRSLHTPFLCLLSTASQRMFLCLHWLCSVCLFGFSLIGRSMDWSIDWWRWSRWRRFVWRLEQQIAVVDLPANLRFSAQLKTRCQRLLHGWGCPQCGLTNEVMRAYEVGRSSLYLCVTR